jgi:hypothetical protein
MTKAIHSILYPQGPFLCFNQINTTTIEIKRLIENREQIRQPAAVAVVFIPTVFVFVVAITKNE